MNVESPYKHTFFRLRQNIYEWGQGWVVSQTAANEWELQVVELLKQLGFTPVHHKIGRVWEGFNAEGESLYMHPMDFTGYIHEANIAKYEAIIKAFETKYWTLSSVDRYPMQSERNQMAWIGTIENNKKKYLEVSN